MLSKTGFYAAAKAWLVSEGASDMTDAAMDVLGRALDLDRLMESQEEDSRSMARKFAEYAEALRTGHNVWAPMGYSTIREMDLRNVKLEYVAEAFADAVRTRFSGAAMTAIRNLRKAAVEAEAEQAQVKLRAIASCTHAWHTTPGGKNDDRCPGCGFTQGEIRNAKAAG